MARLVPAAVATGLVIGASLAAVNAGASQDAHWTLTSGAVSWRLLSGDSLIPIPIPIPVLVVGPDPEPEQVAATEPEPEREQPQPSTGVGLLAACDGVITSAYGYRFHPISGGWRFHDGVDVGADYGTPVYALDSGTVVMAGWNGGYGNYVEIAHSGGLHTFYGHNSEMTVAEGDSVSAGDLIAYVGSTGASTGPHCHIGASVDGGSVNPLDWFPT